VVPHLLEEEGICVNLPNPFLVGDQLVVFAVAPSTMDQVSAMYYERMQFDMINTT
jgi:hypothetical protein